MGKIDKELHKKINDKRIRGEWFNFAHINSIKKNLETLKQHPNFISDNDLEWQYDAKEMTYTAKERKGKKF